MSKKIDEKSNNRFYNNNKIFLNYNSEYTKNTIKNGNTIKSDNPYSNNCTTEIIKINKKSANKNINNINNKNNNNKINNNNNLKEKSILSIRNLFMRCNILLMILLSNFISTSCTSYLSKRILSTKMGKVRGIFEKNTPPLLHVESYLGIKYADLPVYSFRATHSNDDGGDDVPWQFQKPKKIQPTQSSSVQNFVKFKPACPQPHLNLRALKSHRFYTDLCRFLNFMKFSIGLSFLLFNFLFFHSCFQCLIFFILQWTNVTFNGCLLNIEVTHNNLFDGYNNLNVKKHIKLFSLK